MNIKDTQSAIVTYLEKLFADYKVKDTSIKIYKSYVPPKKLENQKESRYPFILVRYYRRKQKMNSGTYETFYDFELLFAVDCGKADDITEDFNLEMMDRIERDLMENPSSVEREFSISQDEIISEMDYEATYETNKIGYVYSYMKLKIWGDNYEPKTLSNMKYDAYSK